MLSEVEKVEPELESLRAAGKAAETEVERTRIWRKVLGTLSPPEDLDSIAGERLELVEKAADIDAARTEIAGRVTAAEKALADLPTSRLLAQWTTTWTELQDTEEQMLGAKTAVVEARGLLAGAVSAHLAARVALDEATDQNRAAHLRRSLEAGHRCPVCDQTVATLPPQLVEPKVDKARSSMEKAEKEVERLTKAASTADSALLRLEERLEGLRKQTAESPPKAELPAIAQRVADADAQLLQARKDDDSIKRKQEQVEQGRKRLADRERDAMLELQNARDRLAGLNPPPLSFDDPAIDWKTLIAWATEQADGDGRCRGRSGGQAG